MAIESGNIISKAVEPEGATTHEEKTDVEPKDNSVVNNNIRDYETRSIDLRTVLGILVRFIPADDPNLLAVSEQALAVTYEACLFSFALPAAILLTINEEVGPSNNIAWAATSWSLASAVVMTIAGRCSDIFGRRNYFVTGNLLGVVGCAIACRSVSTPNPDYS